MPKALCMNKSRLSTETQNRDQVRVEYESKLEERSQTWSWYMHDLVLRVTGHFPANGEAESHCSLLPSACLHNYFNYAFAFWVDLTWLGLALGLTPLLGFESLVSDPTTYATNRHNQGHFSPLHSTPHSPKLPNWCDWCDSWILMIMLIARIMQCATCELNLCEFWLHCWHSIIISIQHQHPASNNQQPTSAASVGHLVISSFGQSELLALPTQN